MVSWICSLAAVEQTLSCLREQTKTDIPSRIKLEIEWLKIERTEYSWKNESFQDQNSDTPTSCIMDAESMQIIMNEVVHFQFRLCNRPQRQHQLFLLMSTKGIFWNLLNLSVHNIRV